MTPSSWLRDFSVSAATIAILTVGTATFAQTSLPPNTPVGVSVPVVSTGNPPAPPYGGTLLLELDSPISASNGLNTIDGFATSSVFRNTNGTLDFLYQFRFSALTDTTIANVSFASYKDVPNVSVAQTADDIDSATGLPAQNAGGATQNFFSEATPSGVADTSFNFATRQGISGVGINAGLTTGVTGGQTTFTFIVRTDATEYSIFGSTSVQGDGISAFTKTAGAIAPFAVATAPEPGSIALLVSGLLPMVAGLALRRRKR
jgi:hypothetical protein